MPSIDPLLDRVPGPNYNCLDFVNEAWTHLFGTSDIIQRLEALSSGVHSSQGRVILSAVRGFVKLDTPVDPCFVVFQRMKMQPHIGIYYKRRVLHLKETGVEFQPLKITKRYFKKIGFYVNDNDK